MENEHWLSLPGAAGTFTAGSFGGPGRFGLFLTIPALSQAAQAVSTSAFPPDAKRAAKSCVKS